MVDSQPVLNIGTRALNPGSSNISVSSANCIE